MPLRLTTAPITDTIVIQSISSTSFPVCESFGALVVRCDCVVTEFDDVRWFDSSSCREFQKLREPKVTVLESPVERRR